MARPACTSPKPLFPEQRHYSQGQTETAVLSSCQTLHHSLDLGSVLPLLGSSRDSGSLFWKSSTGEEFHTCAKTYKKSSATRRSWDLELCITSLWKGSGGPKHGFERLKQTQANGHTLKITPSPNKSTLSDKTNHQVWHIWSFRKASYIQTPQMWGKVLKRQASCILIIIKTLFALISMLLKGNLPYSSYPEEQKYVDRSCDWKSHSYDWPVCKDGVARAFSQGL